LTEFLGLSLFRGVSFLGSRFKVRIADWRCFGTRKFQRLEALVDVYLKAKDPIEKAKRVQKKISRRPRLLQAGRL